MRLAMYLLDNHKVSILTWIMTLLASRWPMPCQIKGGYVTAGVQILKYDSLRGWSVAFEEMDFVVNGAGPST